MKIPGIVLLICLFVLTKPLFSQPADEIDNLFNKVKKFYQTKAEFKEGEDKSIYFYRDSAILQVSDLPIPIEKVKINYKYKLITLIDEDYVAFTCLTEGNCIQRKGKYASYPAGAVYISFKTKSECFEFINLLFDLKKALNR